MYNESTSDSGYFASTAYNSTRPRRLAPVDNSKLGYLARTFRRNMIANHGSAQCREFFSEHDQLSVINDLNSTRPEIIEAIKMPGHEEIFWQSLRNPKAMFEVFTKLMMIFAILSWVGMLFLLLMILLDEPSSIFTIDYPDFFIFPLIFSVFYLVGRLVLNSGIIKDKNNVLFNRRKGIISIPRKKAPPLEMPFDEVDGYIGSTVNPSGSTNYHLIVAHRYSAAFVQHPGGHDEPWKICIQWEYLQNYMDTSKPLPDIPSMEPFRHRDPVTAAYDKQHNRPPGYWKNMDPEKADKMQDAAMAAASGYPWGATREQALAQGWQPSGFGEGDWRDDQTG